VGAKGAFSLLFDGVGGRLLQVGGELVIESAGFATWNLQLADVFGVLWSTRGVIGMGKT
jgi:hypothetical protein